MHKLLAHLEKICTKPRRGGTQSGFNPPAKQSDIDKTELLLGVKFPEAWRLMYLMHNGQFSHYGKFSPPADLPPLFSGYHDWLPLEGIVARWNTDRVVFNSPEKYTPYDLPGCDFISQQFPGCLHIPIAEDNTGCATYLDLAPGPGGNYGQLIYYDSDTGPEFEEWIAISIDLYLEQLIYCLEKKLMVLDSKSSYWINVANGQSVNNLWDVTGYDWEPKKRRRSSK